MKKIFLTFIMVVLVSTGSLFVQPQKADAQILSLDIPNTITNVFNTLESIWNSMAMEVLEPIVKKIADKVLNKLVQSTLNWANGGFDGEPGFINNWDEFLKGTQYEVISGAFDAASIAANNAQQEAGVGGDVDLCVEASGIFEPETCNDQYLNDFEGCIYELDPIEDEELYEACENERDGSEIEYADCLDDWDDYNQMLLNCENGDPGGAAEGNYNAWNSGSVNSTRSVVKTIATAGSQSLNSDTLNSIISGKEENIIDLLGSQSAKDRAKNDLSFMGNAGLNYLLRINRPGNTEVGLNSIVSSALQSKVGKNEKNVVDDLKTPQKFLNKKECTDYADDGSCAREITKTPGDIIGGKVKKSLQKDDDQALLADGLISSLVGAIGSLTDGLINAGLNQLSGAASKAFFNANDAQDVLAVGSEYQSEYDVLGITSDIGDDSIFNPSDAGGGNVLANSIFIGGPEDSPTDEYGNVRIIIDFRKNLDYNIKLLEEEKKYYDEIRKILSGAADILLEFDKCIPGPDFNWRERYKDVLSTTSGEDEDNQINKIGLNETTIMTQDPKVTIPGGVALLNQHEEILAVTRRESLRNKARIDKIKSALSTLQFIKQEIILTFSEQKSLVNPNMVLFNEEWVNLSQIQKEDVLQLAIDTGYYLGSFIADVNGGGINVTDAITLDEEKARNGVIAMSWDLWRTETDPELKLDLRKAYFTTQNNLSNDEFISIVKTKVQQLTKTINQSYSSAADCMVFKLYALGIDRPFLSDIVLGEETVEEQVTTLSNALVAFEPGGTGDVENVGSGNVWNAILGGGFGNWFSGGNTSNFGYYFVDDARSDQTVLSFIESEFELQNDGNDSTQSVFKTLAITSPSSIANSILGFGTQQDKEDYFSVFYNDSDLPWGDTKNKLTLKEMYRVDRVYGDSNAIRSGVHGLLFCRNAGTMGIVIIAGANNNEDGTRCWNDFYTANKLDYKLVISGVNK